jgi:pimeloyl-ACP methyl ester carboxylesterase
MPQFQLHVFRDGDGAPPLVFVHGLLCRYRDWRHQLDHFAPAHRVLACDLRGHGESPHGDAPMDIDTLGRDVADLLESENLSNAVLIGHSMGCRVVMEARHLTPARVAGLVLVDGSRLGADRAKAIENLDAGIARRGFPAVVEALFEGMFFGDPPDWKEEKLAQVRAMPEAVGSALLYAMIDWEARRLNTILSALDIPVLVIQSTAMGADRLRRPLAAGQTSPYQQLLLDRIAGVQSESLPGCGHFCMMEVPGAVNGRIERFIAAL